MRAGMATAPARQWVIRVLVTMAPVTMRAVTMRAAMMQVVTERGTAAKKRSLT